MTARAMTVKLFVASIGGAILGGILSAGLGFAASWIGNSETIPLVGIWAGIGALLGAIQACSHVALQLHLAGAKPIFPTTMTTTTLSTSNNINF